LLQHDTLVIFGSGYTARFVLPPASHYYTHVFATSRAPDNHLGHVPAAQRIRFDLAEPDTWNAIPHQADILWFFPAAPLALVTRFASTLVASSRRLVVLGSTSAYDVSDSREYPPPWIDETAPVDLTKPRVQGEEFLRTTCGAIVLRVAGIYGPGRNPIDWIRDGRVSPSRRYVNLIHVEDLAAICLTALEQGRPGEAYNVSDGTPHTWNEICVTAQQRWGVTAAAIKENRSTGKRISNAKLRAEICYTLKHLDLYEALALIKSAGKVHPQDGQNGFQQGPRREGTGGVPSGVR